jgi:hypothetical protein
MSDSINIIVKGVDNAGSDAPSVKSFLEQINNCLEALTSIDVALDNTGNSPIIWKITNLTKNSPLSVEITPYAVNCGVNITDRVALVKAQTFESLDAIINNKIKPHYLGNNTIAKLRNFAELQTSNALLETTIAFDESKILIMDKSTSQKALANIIKIQAENKKPYQEYGSIEGYIAKIEKSNKNQHIIWIRTRLDEKPVKCLSNNNSFNEVGHLEVEKIWQNLRVLFSGIIYYKSLGEIESLIVDEVKIFPSDSMLPSMESIIDNNFTNGIESLEYLRQMRQDDY